MQSSNKEFEIKEMNPLLYVVGEPSKRYDKYPIDIFIQDYKIIICNRILDKSIELDMNNWYIRDFNIFKFNCSSSILSSVESVSKDKAYIYIPNTSGTQIEKAISLVDFYNDYNEIERINNATGTKLIKATVRLIIAVIVMGIITVLSK